MSVDKKETQHNVSVSMPYAGLLGIAFIVLKLTGVIAWSWLWVLAPFWIPLALFFVIMLIWFLIYVFTGHA